MRYSSIFRNDEALREMLLLRSQGHSLKSLAHKYSVDHTTIRRICIQHGLPTVVRLVVIQHDSRLYDDWNGEVINRGKSYSQYLRDEEKRQLANFRKRISAKMELQKLQRNQDLYASDIERNENNGSNEEGVRGEEGGERLLRVPQ